MSFNINALIIRDALASDMPAVHALVQELALYEKAPEAVITTPAQYVADFEAGIFRCIVAEHEGQVVGMMLYYIAYSTWKGRMLYLDDFVITDSLRGQGIGQLLYPKLLEKAKEAGCSLMKWQVLDWNEPAIRFYQRIGAEFENEWLNVKVIL